MCLVIECQGPSSSACTCRKLCYLDSHTCLDAGRSMQALEHLHERRIVHRLGLNASQISAAGIFLPKLVVSGDIKPENALLDEHGYAKA